MKGAILLHGWGTDRHVWHKHWMLDNEAPMLNLLRSLDIEPVVLELPGLYLDRDKDFNWYANYLGHVIRERDDLESIDIIGHSMGGIVSRTYLGLDSEKFKEGQMRVERTISLGTPNHGTSVPHFNIISRFFSTIADFVLPWKNGMVKGEEHNYFMTTPCYRDIQLGSDFLFKLNSNGIDSHVEQHLIWTNGDTVAEPQHTCVLPGAYNHLIDRVMVNHFNMTYRQEVMDTIEEILKGERGVNGLQTYPSKNRCAHPSGHIWLPDPGLGSRESLNIWRCSSCEETIYCLALPLQLSCRSNGKLPSLHKWNLQGRFHRYRFRCSRCKEIIWYPDPGNGGIHQ